MKRTLSFSLRWLLATVLLAPTLLLPGKAEILDPAANHPVLREIAEDLHRHGIDVVQDWNSRLPAYTRPVVAPLGDYPISIPQNESRWIREFNASAIGALAAFKPIGKLKHDTFDKQWRDTPKHRRVFISFAREDLAVALSVKEALIAQGYIVFTYLTREVAVPSWPLSAVADYLRTADTHLVIDTETSRRKQGVLAEAIALGRSQGPTLVTRGPTLVNSPSLRDLMTVRPTLNAPQLFGDVIEVTESPTVVTGGARRSVVTIYGARKRCPRTRQAIQIFEEAGAQVRYLDVDASPRANRVVIRNRRWLEKGLLPLVKVDGKLIRFTNEGVARALESLVVPHP
jgi:hypothetical protein